MQKISVSIEDDHVETLEERQDSGDASSRSDAVRQILDEYEELRAEYDELHTRYEELEAECDELRTRLESRGQRIEDLEEQLARRSQVEQQVEELQIEVREQQQEQQLSNAPFFVRWAHWYRSRGEDDDEE